MNKIKKICIIIFVLLLLYLIITVAFRSYVEKNTEFKYLNNQYIKFNRFADNFIPFGADNNWYDNNIEYYNVFGISFLKSDNERNFIYYNDFLGTTVYKKEGFELPQFPPYYNVDELIVFYDESDEYITIKSEQEIKTIINYLSQIETSENLQQERQINFYAVSKELGGIYSLNKRGSIYFSNKYTIKQGNIISEEIPNDIQNILISKIKSAQGTECTGDGSVSCDND